MADKDALGDRRRGLEEEYFHRKEKELIEKMRRHAEEESARRRLGEKAGVASEDILNDLQELGYTPETVMLLHLTPLIQTAWAEGSITPRERELIIKAARSRGIERRYGRRRAAREAADRAPIAGIFREDASRDRRHPADATARGSSENGARSRVVKRGDCGRLWRHHGISHRVRRGTSDSRKHSGEELEKGGKR